MRRNKDPRRWAAWRASGAVERPQFSSTELSVEPTEPDAPDFSIKFTCTDQDLCRAYNQAIRELMLAKKMKPLHLDTTVHGDVNSPGTHTWVMQSNKHDQSDLHDLLQEIHPVARGRFFNTWIHSPTS
jgi:hypothetical protein